MCAAGSSSSRTPGLSRPCGSSSRLISCMTSYSSSPYCRRTNGAMIRPVPCSALSVPSWPSTRSTMSSVNAQVALDVVRGVEVLVEHEVDVAVLGVPEDHAARVAVPVEQPDQLGAGRQQPLDRDGDVLEQRGRPGRPGAGDRGVEALADVPQRRPGRRVGAQRTRAGERQVAEDPQRGAATRSSSSSAVGCWCSTSRAAWSRTSSARSSAVAPGSVCPTRRLVASSSSIVAKPAPTRAGQRAGGRGEVGEHQQGGGGVRVRRDGAERRRGDERQRALAAHDEVQRARRRGGRGRRRSSRRSPSCS